METNIIYLKPARKKSLLKHHPWIFSRAILNESENISNGALVDVYCGTEFMGSGFYSKFSSIRVRIISFDKKCKEISRLFLKKLLQRAYEYRKRLKLDEITDAYRIFYSEADGLPGLVVDRYEHNLSVQFLTAGVHELKSEIMNILKNEFYPDVILELTKGDFLKREGLRERVGVYYGKLNSNYITITEDDLKYYVDIIKGHKTGFYLDQRCNRVLLKRLSKNKKVLNVFSYTGGFCVSALKGGADYVVNIDSSKHWLELLMENVKLNKFNVNKIENICGDAFTVLRTLVDSKSKFDIVILDPPKFAYKKEDIDSAIKGYKDINLYAMKLLNKGGLLFTFSCSGLIDGELFKKILCFSAKDLNKDIIILKRLMQAPDHPIKLNFPESEYLKGYLCMVY